MFVQGYSKNYRENFTKSKFILDIATMPQNGSSLWEHGAAFKYLLLRCITIKINKNINDDSYMS